ncbi:hypothetical protein HJ590_17370 [Naumannella sp. ID2617S]|nr:hypothetical protein [Naumannella sp. ID2617S]
MTVQMTDKIKINQRWWSLAGDPLSPILEEWDDVPPFVAPHTANWRGYQARWRVTDDGLYLTGLTAHVQLANGQILEVPGRSVLGARRLPMRADFVYGSWRVFRGEVSFGPDVYAFGSEQMLMEVDAGRVEFGPVIGSWEAPG